MVGDFLMRQLIWIKLLGEIIQLVPLTARFLM